MRPSAFLRTLWGDRPAGLIQLWQLDGRRSTYLRSPELGDRCAAGVTDCFTGVGLAGRDLGPGRRAAAREVVAIAGLWLDVDVDDGTDGPGGKRGGAPHVGAAAALASAVLTPTLLIRSGHGLHAWWLFEQPWQLTAPAQQAAAALASLRWQQRHRALAAVGGFGLDATHDLARLLRPPGTFNGKGGGAAPVRLIGRGPRHDRDRLVARALAWEEPAEARGAQQLPLAGSSAAGSSAARPSVVGSSAADASAAAPLRPAAVPAPLRARLRELLAADARFAATWRHQRRDGAGWSLSEYDLSLAVQLAAAGFDDAAIADAIRLHRRRWRADDRKGERVDYLRRTIDKARGSRHARPAAPAPAPGESGGRQERGR